MNGQNEMLEPKDICRTARKAAKIKQKVMAKLVGIGTTTLWRWEKGHIEAPDTYISICEIILRLQQDGEGLEIKVFDVLNGTDSEKRSLKSALFALWAFCNDEGKAYIVKEMSGSDVAASRNIEIVEGDRGDASMDATMSMLTDFSKSIKDRVMKLPPNILDKYMDGLADLAGGIEKLKIALEYEQSIQKEKENTNEQA